MKINSKVQTHCNLLGPLDRGVFRGGAIGAKRPPGPVKSTDFRGFSCHNGC